MMLKRGWFAFVNAWEKRLGDTRRKGREIADDEVLVISGAFEEWRAAAKSSHISATDWLEQHASKYEALGYHRPPQQDETVILSGWDYSVRSFDDQGRWAPQGDRFAATRSFKYEVGGWMGMRTGYTHLEHCGHAHESHVAALPCLEDYRRLGGRPTKADLEPKAPRLSARGAFRGWSEENQFDGNIDAWDAGLAVPHGDTQLLIGWNQLRSVSPDTQKSELRVYPVEGLSKGEIGLAFVHIIEFGDAGVNAWIEFMRGKGLAVEDGAAGS
jgi:hypothetical protein